MLRRLAAPLPAAAFRQMSVSLLSAHSSRSFGVSAAQYERRRKNKRDLEMRALNVELTKMKQLAERLDKQDPEGGPESPGSKLPPSAFERPPESEVDAFAAALEEPPPLTPEQIRVMERIQLHRMRVAVAHLPELFSERFRQRLGRNRQMWIASTVRALANRLLQADTEPHLPVAQAAESATSTKNSETAKLEGNQPDLTEPIMVLQGKAGLKERLLAVEGSLPPPLKPVPETKEELPQNSVPKPRKDEEDYSKKVEDIAQAETKPTEFDVPLSTNDILLNLLTRLRDTAGTQVSMKNIVTPQELEALSTICAVEKNLDGIKALVQVGHMMDKVHYSEVAHAQARQEVARYEAARQHAVSGMEYIKPTPAQNQDTLGRTDPASSYALARTTMAHGIGRTLSNSGDYELLKAIYREIADSMYSIHSFNKHWCWIWELTNYLCDLAAGVEMTGDMKDYLIRAQLKSGDLEGAVRTITALEESSPAKEKTYTAVIIALFRKDDLPSTKQAWSLFHQMRLAAHPVPDEVTYTRMILACASGKIPEQNVHHWRSSAGERAMDLFREMTMTYHVRPSLNTYNAVIHALSRDYEFAPDAVAVYRQLVDMQFSRPRDQSLEGETGLEYVPDRTTFNNLLEAFDGTGDLAQAKWVMGEMLRVAAAFVGENTAPPHRTREQNLVDAVARLPDSRSLSLLFHCYAHYNPPLEPLLQEAREAAMKREREELSRMERGLSPDDDEDPTEPPDEGFQSLKPPKMSIREWREKKASQALEDMEAAAGLGHEDTESNSQEPENKNRLSGPDPTPSEKSTPPESSSEGVYDIDNDALSPKDEAQASKDKQELSETLERKREEVMAKIDQLQDRKDEQGGIIVPDKPGMTTEEKAEKVASHVLRMAEAQRTAELEARQHVTSDVAQGVSLPQTSAGVLREVSAIMGSLQQSAFGERNMAKMAQTGVLDPWIVAKVDSDVLAAYLRVLLSHGAPDQVLFTLHAAMFSPNPEENLYNRFKLQPDRRAYEWLFRTGIFYDETDPLRPQVDKILDDAWERFVESPHYLNPASFNVWRLRIENLARSFRLDEAMAHFKQFVLTLPPITTDVINGKIPLDKQSLEMLSREAKGYSRSKGPHRGDLYEDQNDEVNDSLNQEQKQDQPQHPRQRQGPLQGDGARPLTRLEMRRLTHQLATGKRYRFPTGDFNHLRNRLALTYRHKDLELVKHAQTVYQMQMGHLLRATNQTRAQAPPLPLTRVGGLTPIAEDETRKATVKRKHTNWQAKAARRLRKQRYKASKK